MNSVTIKKNEVMSKFGFKRGAFLLNILSCLGPNLVLTIWNPIVEPMEEKVGTMQVKLSLCWVADPRWIQCICHFTKKFVCQSQKDSPFLSLDLQI